MGYKHVVSRDSVCIIHQEYEYVNCLCIPQIRTAITFLHVPIIINDISPAPTQHRLSSARVRPYQLLYISSNTTIMILQNYYTIS